MADGPNNAGRPSWLLIALPAFLFFVKDMIATIIVLSYEPGITAQAVENYADQLLPGSLFVITGNAPLVNIGFGLVIGLFLYFGALLRRRRAQT